MFFTSTLWKNDRCLDTSPEDQDGIVGMFDAYSLQVILWHISFVFHRRYNDELGEEEKENISSSKQLNFFFFFLVSFIVFDGVCIYRHRGTKTFICCEVVKIYPTEFTYQYSFQTVSSYHQLSAQSCWLHINKQIAGSDLLCQLQSENIKFIMLMNFMAFITNIHLLQTKFVGWFLYCVSTDFLAFEY